MGTRPGGPGATGGPRTATPHAPERRASPFPGLEFSPAQPLAFSAPVDRRERRQQLRPRGEPLVEGGIGAEETAGDRLRGDGKSVHGQALLRRSVVDVEGGEALALQFLRVVGDGETQLLLVPLFVGLRG